MEFPYTFASYKRMETFGFCPNYYTFNYGLKIKI